MYISISTYTYTSIHISLSLSIYIYIYICTYQAERRAPRVDAGGRGQAGGSPGLQGREGGGYDSILL